MSRCLGCLAAVLRTGRDSGAFALADPDYTANAMWTQALGLMHLARLRVGVRREASGDPGLFTVGGDQVVRTCVDSALLLAGAGRSPD
jgi:hypothetical protein